MPNANTVYLVEKNRGDSAQLPVRVFDQGSEGKINVNTADENQLTQLPGVGPALARKIIQEREKNGYFYYLEDLRVVNGIGEKMIEKIRDLICFKVPEV